jgi:hypothetical protein
LDGDTRSPSRSLRPRQTSAAERYDIAGRWRWFVHAGQAVDFEHPVKLLARHFTHRDQLRDRQRLVHIAPSGAARRRPWRRASSLTEIAGDAALLVDPYETDQIARAITTIVNDCDLRAELSRRGPAQAAKFSVDRYRERVEAVYAALR